MAFVRLRTDGRFEIRESFATPAGPRTRTLATFVTLTDEVVDQAAARATTPFDEDRVRATALKLGAVPDRPLVERAGRQLLAELGRGRPLPVALRELLRAELSPGEESPRPELAAVVPWMSATGHDRGAAVYDLLLLADRIPHRRQSSLAFPRLRSRA
jgi:hypothetical protein